MNFCVDFDGTIVEEAFPRIGLEKPFAIEALLRLKESGHKVFLWTSREGKPLKEAIQFLHRRGVFPDQLDVSPRKHHADYYLDDKGFPPFSGWERFLKWAEASQVVRHAV